MQQKDPIPLDEITASGAEWKSHGKNVSIIRSVLAIVSLVASSTLIWMLLRSKVRLSSTYHRLLIGMSIADMLYSLSLAHFNSTAPSDDDYMVWNARGNQATCSAQGFILFMGAISGLLYSCSLNLYYLAVVRYKKSDKYIRTKMEPFLHGIPVACALVCTTTFLVKKNINSDGEGICFIPVHEPPHCIGYEDGQIREGFEIPCGRGRDGAVLFAYLGFYLTLFAVPVIIGISLGMIYKSVLQQEKKLGRYGVNAFTASARQLSADDDDVRARGSLTVRISRLLMLSSPTSSQERNKSRAVLHRAIAYSIAYFLAWSFVIIHISLILAGIEWPTSLSYLTSIFNPLQGYYNFVIFIYPKVLTAKRSKRDNLTWCQAFAKAFRSRGGDSTRNRGQPNNRIMQENNNMQPSGAEEEKSPEAEEERVEIRRRSSVI